MPGKERLKKRKEQYEKLYRLFGNIRTNDPFAEEKQKIRESLRTLNEKIAAFTAGDDAQEKKLSPKQMKEMINAYGDLLWDMDVLLRGMNEKYNDLDSRIHLKRGQKRELAALKSEIPQFDLIADTLGKDLTAFREAKDKNKSLTMHELYETSRVDSSYKVKEGKAIEFASGEYNTRMKLTIIDKDNNEIEGYFTEETEEHPTLAQAQKKAFENNRKKYGSAGEFISLDKLKKIREATKSVVLEELISKSVFDMDFEEAVEFIAKDTGDGYNMRKILNTPEKLRAFTDMMSDHCNLEAQFFLRENMGMSENGHVNRRNAAMSGIAELLGCDNILAHSKNIKLTVNGEEKKGTFMKKAEGADYNKVKFDSDLVNLTEDSTENLSLKKQVADLQILDFICGNPDRHAGNIFYITEKDKDGNVIISGIKGIDNDTSFGSRDLFLQKMKEVRLEDMKVITRQMADKILALTRETLNQMLYGYELSSGEIDNMVERVKELQRKIREDDRFYSHGFAKGVLVDGRIRIVDDEEMNMLSFNEDLAKYDKENLFQRVKDLTPASKKLYSILDNYENDFRKSVTNFTSDTIMDFVSSMDSIASDDKTLQTGSPQYTAMRNATKDVLDAMRKYTGPHYDKNTDGGLLMSEKLSEIQSKIDAAITACEAYKTYKHNRNINEHKQDFDPSPHKLTRAERRWQNVENNITLLKKQKTLFEKLQQDFKTFDEASKKFEHLKAQRRLAEADKPTVDRTRIIDNRAYENFKSRSLYLLLQEDSYSDNTKLEIEERRESELLFRVKLGYTLRTLKPEDRAKFRIDLEKATDRKFEGSDDDLFKEAVGFELIHRIYELRLITKRLTAEQEDLDELNRLEQMIKTDEDDDIYETYDNLVKTEAFKQYYKDISERFDIDSRRNADEKNRSEGKFVNNVSKALMGRVDPSVKISKGFELKDMLDLFAEKFGIEKNKKTGNERDSDVSLSNKSFVKTGS